MYPKFLLEKDIYIFSGFIYDEKCIVLIDVQIYIYGCAPSKFIKRFQQEVTSAWHFGFWYIDKRKKACPANGLDGTSANEGQKHRQTMVEPLANDSFSLRIHAQRAGASQEKTACGNTN